MLEEIAPGNLLDPGTDRLCRASPALTDEFFAINPPGKPSS